MPTHSANSKARAVFRRESEKQKPSRHSALCLHVTLLQAMLRQESVVLTRVTTRHSATLHYIHYTTPTRQRDDNSARLPLSFLSTEATECQRLFNTVPCPAPTRTSTHPFIRNGFGVQGQYRKTIDKH
ncbi:MAG: hypothetical protein OXC79_10780 [Candidatus Poribacteria bacterium]|nr:hypothetical protein [Candidatus Poribacteria bacterium]